MRAMDNRARAIPD